MAEGAKHQPNEHPIIKVNNFVFPSSPRKPYRICLLYWTGGWIWIYSPPVEIPVKFFEHLYDPILEPKDRLKSISLSGNESLAKRFLV